MAKITPSTTTGVQLVDAPAELASVLETASFDVSLTVQRRDGRVLAPSDEKLLATVLRASSACRGRRKGRSIHRLASTIAAVTLGCCIGTRARPAMEGYGSQFPCPLPSSLGPNNEASVVRLRVTVSAEGKAEDVEVLSAPNDDLARAARACVQGRIYDPARDGEGHPIEGTTAPTEVRFAR